MREKLWCVTTFATVHSCMAAERATFPEPETAAMARRQPSLREEIDAVEKEEFVTK